VNSVGIPETNPYGYGGMVVLFECETVFFFGSSRSNLGL
jgi:hypothetical protein